MHTNAFRGVTLGFEQVSVGVIGRPGLEPQGPLDINCRVCKCAFNTVFSSVVRESYQGPPRAAFPSPAPSAVLFLFLGDYLDGEPVSEGQIRLPGFGHPYLRSGTARVLRCVMRGRTESGALRGGKVVNNGV